MRTTQVHLYGLYLDLYLWDQPHYRAKTYRHDLLAVRFSGEID